MSSLYIASPLTSHEITVVSTGTAIKTLLQVATPSTRAIKVAAWGVSFAGVVATDPAGLVALLDTNVAATVTSLTPAPWLNPDDPASLCVGGVSATGYNGSVEGTITASKILDPQHVHPQTGYSLWYPAGKEPLIKVSRFLRIRSNFSVSVNAIPWIIFAE